MLLRASFSKTLPERCPISPWKFRWNRTMSACVKLSDDLYSDEAIERSMDYALEAGCKRLDLFFMVGLKEQTYESVMGTVEYSRDC
jgi:hypothetical protein